MAKYNTKRSLEEINKIINMEGGFTAIYPAEDESCGESFCYVYRTNAHNAKYCVSYTRCFASGNAAVTERHYVGNDEIVTKEWESLCEHTDGSYSYKLDKNETDRILENGNYHEKMVVKLWLSLRS